MTLPGTQVYTCDEFKIGKKDLSLIRRRKHDVSISCSMNNIQLDYVESSVVLNSEASKNRMKGEVYWNH